MDTRLTITCSRCRRRFSVPEEDAAGPLICLRCATEDLVALTCTLCPGPCECRPNFIKMADVEEVRDGNGNRSAGAYAGATTR